MPRVPRAERAIGRRPINAPTVSTDVPRGAGGYGPQIDTRGLEQGLQTVYDVQLRRFNTTAIREADRRASELEMRVIHDPKTGILSMQGKNVLEARKRIDEDWAKGVSEIEATLSNDVQREAFRNSVMSRRESIERVTAEHTSRQLKEYEKEETEAGINSERDAAVAAAVPGVSFSTMLDRASLAVGRQRAMIVDWANSQGYSPEAKDKMLKEHTSRTHALIISRLLNNGSDKVAKEYYNEVREQIVGEELVRVENAVQEASYRGSAQKHTDTILQNHGDRKSALAAAREIQDPKERELTENYVNQRFNEIESIRRERQNEVYLEATNLVDARPGVEPRLIIPPNKWEQLSLEQRSALERRQDGPANNDDKVWLSFISMGIPERGKMDQVEFETKVWSKLDRSHRERAAELWRISVDAVNTGKFATPEITTAVETLRQIDNTLRTTGLIKGDKDRGELSSVERKLYARFEHDAQQRINEFELTQLQGKRKATYEERQVILDKMAYTKVFTDRSFRGKPDNPKQIHQLTDDDKGRAFVPFVDIPTNEVEAIKARIIRAGRRVSTNKIERAYAAVLMGDDLLVLSIINSDEDR